ncbi:glycosyltransferase [Naumannella halotolerans]|uniref:glycosyltransferase n=1 Tax=Naumannella halotolerans TaxID=993414 RepID=UPI00370D379F
MAEPFSVLLPVYAGDDPDHFRRAVHSVTTEQSRRPDELVVIQDGPVPGALSSMLDRLRRESPVRLVHHRVPVNAGLSHALSIGLEVCRHDVVARMDADDISLPGRFAAQLPVIEAGAELVGSGMYEFTDEETITARRTPPVGSAEIAAFATFHDPFNHPTVVYRRSAVRAAGGYRELDLMEDYWLFARMIQRGAKVANLPDPLVMYRVDSGSYDRRGGWRLFRSEWSIQREFLRSGFTNRFQFLRNLLIRGGYRFVPVRIRRALYQRRFSRPASLDG